MSELLQNFNKRLKFGDKCDILFIEYHCNALQFGLVERPGSTKWQVRHTPFLLPHFGEYDYRSPYYIISMILHDQAIDITDEMGKPEEEHYDFFMSYETVKIYYDNGQVEVRFYRRFSIFFLIILNLGGLFRQITDCFKWQIWFVLLN